MFLTLSLLSGCCFCGFRSSLFSLDGLEAVDGRDSDLGLSVSFVPTIHFKDLCTEAIISKRKLIVFIVRGILILPKKTGILIYSRFQFFIFRLFPSQLCSFSFTSPSVNFLLFLIFQCRFILFPGFTVLVYFLPRSKEYLFPIPYFPER